MTDTPDTSDLVIQTVARNFLVKLTTLAIGMAGSALVTHGFATQDQVNQLVPDLVQIIVGVALAGGAAVLAYLRALRKRDKETALRVADPAAVVVRGAGA